MQPAGPGELDNIDTAVYSTYSLAFHELSHLQLAPRAPQLIYSWRHIVKWWHDNANFDRLASRLDLSHSEVLQNSLALFLALQLAELGNRELIMWHNAGELVIENWRHGHSSSRTNKCMSEILRHTETGDIL